MIKTLLFAKKENEDIIKSALNGIEHEKPRKQIGYNWSFHHIINTDLKNYQDCTHFVIDISAFKEQGDEFISLLEELRGKYKFTIILYCAELYGGDKFLDILVRSGFNNIVADYSGKTARESVELMRGDLAECFSESGLSEQKYSRFFIASETETTEKSEPQNTPTVFSDSDVIVTVFGAQKRIGATTLAMSLCEYCGNLNGRALLVLCGESAGMEFDLMKRYFEIEETADVIRVKNFDVTVSDSDTDFGNYDFVVFDCGDIHENVAHIEYCKDADYVFLCGGIGWKELHHTLSAQKYLSEVRYTVVVDTNDSEKFDSFSEDLCMNLNDVVRTDYRDSAEAGKLMKGGCENA